MRGQGLQAPASSAHGPPSSKGSETQMNHTHEEALEIFKYLVASAWGEGDREIAWCRHDPALARNLEMLQEDFEELYDMTNQPTESE